ncbi:MAG: hypothetical protein JWQ16_1719 [Novosphingobium sp.]|nr:hypothetical protein [Novosphingobium sp.]
MDGEPETLRERFGAGWPGTRPMDNRFNPRELVPKSRAFVIRHEADERVIDVMSWDVLGGTAKFPMTNVRQLDLPQWQRLAQRPQNRCLVPLTEFAEWTPGKINLQDGKPPLKGEMWFSVPEQPVFAVAGFWRMMGDIGRFAMVTCDPNPLVAPIHPKAMLTILEEADWDRWLTCSYDEAVALQRPFPADRMSVRGPIFSTREPKGSLL